MLQKFSQNHFEGLHPELGAVLDLPVNSPKTHFQNKKDRILEIWPNISIIRLDSANETYFANKTFAENLLDF